MLYGGWATHGNPYVTQMPGMPYYQLHPQTMQQNVGMPPITQPVGTLPHGGGQAPAVSAAPTALTAATTAQTPAQPAQQPPPQPFDAAQLAALLQNPAFMQMAKGFYDQQQQPKSQ